MEVFVTYRGGTIGDEVEARAQDAPLDFAVRLARVAQEILIDEGA